jgi:hypothetical protein
MRQWPLVLEYLAKIAHVEVTAAGLALHEVLALVFRLAADARSDVLSAPDWFIH